MPLNWPAKDPDEVLDYDVDWTAPLAGDTIATSNFSVITGPITVNSQTNGSDYSRIWLAGGTPGTVVVLQCRITTIGGRTLEETVNLPIRSTAEAVPSTPGYNVPTAADLQARWDAFAAVDESAIAGAIQEAQRFVDTSWAEGDYTLGIMLYAAHILTLDGLGSGAEAQAAAAGTSGFKVMRSGSLTLERDTGSGGSSGSDPLGLNATAYGKRFRTLLRVNKSGPRTTSAAAPVPLGMANDWPYIFPYGY